MQVKRRGFSVSQVAKAVGVLLRFACRNKVFCCVAIHKTEIYSEQTL